MWDPLGEFSRIPFDNGLTVYAATWPGRAWQKIGFVVHSGAKDDPRGKEGTAHLLEHLLDHTIPSSHEKATRLIAEHGGDIDDWDTTAASTYFLAHIPTTKESVRYILQYFGELLTQATISRKIGSEKKIVLREYDIDYPHPEDYERLRRMHHMLWPRHWLQRAFPILGTPASINAITKKDLQNFYDGHYAPGNISVITFGGIPKKNILKAIERSPLGTSRKQGASKKKTRRFVNVPKPAELTYEQHSEVRKGSIRTSATYRSALLLPGAIKNCVVQTAGSILQAELDSSLRAKQKLVYSNDISCDTYGQFYLITIDVPSIAPETLARFIRCIDSCLLSALNDPTAFDDQKLAIIHEQELRDLNGTMVMEQAIESVTLNNRITDIRDTIEEYKNMVFEEVRALAPWFDRSNRHTTIIHP